MSDILIYKESHQYGEYDLTCHTNYEGVIACVDKYYTGICPNFGNKLWLNGIVTALQTDNNLIFLNEDMNPDFINQNFDYVVLPMANIFYAGYADAIEKLSIVFEKIHIPTYVIACGVQTDSYDDLDLLISQIGDIAYRFIRAIYNTGGEFALRGYFTEEFFHKLGFHSAVVTGCPSLYAKGGELQIVKPYIEEKELNPVINGRLENKYGTIKYMKEYPTSYYIDQCDYFDMLYKTAVKQRQEEQFSLLVDYVRKYGFTSVDLAVHDRIKLFFDIPVWEKFLLDNHINFSYGTRIHGNIMSVLCGIPAVVCIVDSRTREMTEFFHMPSDNPNNANKSLYMRFCNCDYQVFNKDFRKKYIDFRTFLFKYGLVRSIEYSPVEDVSTLLSTDIELCKNNNIQILCDSFDEHRIFFRLESVFGKLLSKVKRVIK